MRQLDDALRAAGLAPALLAEGVKMATVNLMKDEHGGRFPPAEAYPPAARLIAYCALGAEMFGRENGAGPARAVEERIEAASAAGEGLDADLLLLMLHAQLVQPDVRENFGLSAENER